MAKKKPAPVTAPPPVLGGVTFTPRLAMLPGNLVTFSARHGHGLVEAQVTTNRDSWRGLASNGPDEAAVSKLIETGHTVVTVSFFEDGSEYASGTYVVEG